MMESCGNITSRCGGIFHSLFNEHEVYAEDQAVIALHVPVSKASFRKSMPGVLWLGAAAE